jgi:D-alanine--poly(phosphoribitol) ligase subunit 1
MTDTTYRSDLPEPPSSVLGRSEVFETSLLEAMLQHAEARPRQLAVKDDDESLFYADLAERVAATASGLAQIGVHQGDRVALSIPNSAQFVVAALACLWLGSPFIPIAIDDPPPRRATIVKDSNATWLLDLGSDHELTVRRIGADAEIRVEGTALPIAAETPPPRATDGGRDAYVIYTSGTTGVPKGVCISEMAFRWAVQCAAGSIGLDEGTRTLCVSPFHFDGSYGTAFSTLAAGGSLVIPRREDLLFLRRFFRALREDQITHTGFSPSYLRLLLSSPECERLGDSQLQTLGLGGEESLAKDLGRLWEIRPSLRIFNRYGPTETAIEVTTYEITREDLAEDRIPIGVPHPGVSFHLVAPDGTVLEQAHTVGELYIGGNQLMNGYWGDPRLTRSVLRSDVIPGELLYKTGDLMYRDERGRYVYMFRGDDVIKRRGVRISLVEIAKAMQSIEHVMRVECIEGPSANGVRIIAFVETDASTNARAILAAAREYLPATMLPDDVSIVATLPMSSAGKVDRRRLRAMYGAGRGQPDAGPERG